MRSVYTGGDLAGFPPTSGDTFTNTVSLSGRHHADRHRPAWRHGRDRSTDGRAIPLRRRRRPAAASINKTIKPREFPYECDATDRSSSRSFPDRDFVFRKGDRICFELEVVFPQNVDARNPVITDFIPAGTRYEPGSQFLVAPFEVRSDFNEQAAAGGWRTRRGCSGPSWAVLATCSCPRAAVWRARFSVIVERSGDRRGGRHHRQPHEGARRRTTPGQGVSFRDELPLGIAPAPDVGIVKGVQSVTSGADTTVVDPDRSRHPRQRRRRGSGGPARRGHLPGGRHQLR